MNAVDPKLTFGQKAVGLSFNPSGSSEVNQIKAKFADAIDLCHNKRMDSDSGEVKRMMSVAITKLQEAQMWAVKAVTWVD